MSENKLLKNVSSDYILRHIFSFLPVYISHRIIKYNKTFQTKLEINFKDSIFNYQLYILTKEKIMKNIEDIENKYQYISKVSFNAKFSFYYSYNSQIHLNDICNTNIFLKKYKGFKINDYPIHSNFESMNNKDKITFLEKNECFYKYTLNDENVRFIDSINKFRENNKMNKLMYNKIENMNDYFKEKESKNENYLLDYPLGELNDNLLNNDENLKKILLINDLNCIMILEKEIHVYVFIYSIRNEKDEQKIDAPQNIHAKFFHIINNTIPKVTLKMLPRTIFKFSNNLKDTFKCEGFQIFSFKYDTLIGLLEGPPKTPFENGYFLFKMLFPEGFEFKPPQFIFMTKIFHPNISEDGFVSVDILQNEWSPALLSIQKIIYSIQSLLDDPNPDIFLNEQAAKLCKENKEIYNQTVSVYISLYANYSKFLEDIRNMNIIIKINEEGKEFILSEED